jgi:hypothetical protein
MEGGTVRHNFERDPPKDHPCQVWFNLVQGFQRRRFKCESLRRTTSDGKTRKEQFCDDLISLVQTVLVVLQKDVEIKKNIYGHQ